VYFLNVSDRLLCQGKVVLVFFFTYSTHFLYFIFDNVILWFAGSAGGGGCGECASATVQSHHQRTRSSQSSCEYCGARYEISAHVNK
jgi:hypothetical protein